MVQATVPIASVAVGAEEVQDTFSGVVAFASPSILTFAVSVSSVTVIRTLRRPTLASSSVAMTVTS